MGSNCVDDPRMPQVGMMIEHSSHGSWRVIRNIASGPFSDVYIVCSSENRKEKYAMKCEKQEGNVRPVLKLDVMVLAAVKGNPGFPKFLAAGRTDYYRYCVMQLVGPDLGKLRRSLPDKRFSPSTALRVLQQTLQRLETLHDVGWLCRDVKAPNFAIGLGDEASTIYMLDFGFARKYKAANGDVIPPRPSAALMGTFQYASLASHAHKDQAPKDDLESWLYMAVEILKGPLPWCRLNGHKEHHLMAEWKQAVRKAERTDFLDGLPAEFDEIMRMIDNMGFYERPDYRRLHGLLEEASERLDITLHEPFDWQANRRLVKKAEWVGELGESHLASDKLDNEDLDSDRTPIDIETM